MKTFREFLKKIMEQGTVVQVGSYSAPLSASTGRITEVNKDYIIVTGDIYNETTVGGPRLDTTAIPISPGLVVNIPTFTKK